MIHAFLQTCIVTVRKENNLFVFSFAARWHENIKKKKIQFFIFFGRQEQLCVDSPPPPKCLRFIRRIRDDKKYFGYYNILLHRL